MHALGIVRTRDVTISKWSGADFPKIPLEDSAKKWQNSFFYVCNLGADHINLPLFAIAPPRATR